MGSSERTGSQRKYSTSTIVRICLIAVFAVTAILSGYMLIRNANENRESDEIYADLDSFLTIPSASPSTEPVPSTAPTVGSSEEPGMLIPLPTEESPGEPSASPVPTPEPEPPLPEADFEALSAMNSDVTAWIRIEGTNLNYPVVQTSNNDYYLNHLFTGTWNRSGCPFLDHLNSADFSDTNSIIYGHNRRNGAMFATLLNYRRQNYFNAHPTVTLLLPDVGYSVRIFAVLYADPGEAGSEFSPWRMHFPDRESLDTWADTLAAKSIVDCGSPEHTGRVLTLSTCDNSNDGRFVVLGWIPTPVEETPDEPTEDVFGETAEPTSAEPSEAVSDDPSVENSDEPTGEPSETPTGEPMEDPSEVPPDEVSEPTPEGPSIEPEDASAEPSEEPIESPESPDPDENV